MNISSYLFQSPYPSSVQFGRPDPAVKAQEQSQEAVDALTQTQSKPMQQKADAYMSGVKEASGINIAGSMQNSTVVQAVENFTQLNNQTQAVEAYSS